MRKRARRFRLVHAPGIQTMASGSTVISDLRGRTCRRSSWACEVRSAASIRATSCFACSSSSLRCRSNSSRLSRARATSCFCLATRPARRAVEEARSTFLRLNFLRPKIAPKIEEPAEMAVSTDRS